jgi:hypothetical protein
MYHSDVDGPVLPVSKCAVDVEKIAAAEHGDISSMNVNEYMSWVQQQASTIPGVVRVEVSSAPAADSASTVVDDDCNSYSADFQDNSIPKRSISDILEFTGNAAWKKYTLLEFERLREVSLCAVLCAVWLH